MRTRDRRLAAAAQGWSGAVIDRFGRRIDYLRLSVTDRCNFRCSYCLAPGATFVPKADILSLEELVRLARAFIRLGVRRVRVTGGEPLLRRDVLLLFEALAEDLAGNALDELTLTTNGSRLSCHGAALAACGVRRINVSLDTLDPKRFHRLTGGGSLDDVLAGLDAARRAGLAVRINTVVLSGINEFDINGLVAWCGREGFDLCLIEKMPFAEGGGDPLRRELPMSVVRQRLDQAWTLTDVAWRSAGPARYVHVAETGGRIGFIAPLSQRFCEICNRVRVSCTGTLYPCLGGERTVDLLTPLRSAGGEVALSDAINAALLQRPQGHAFSAKGAAADGESEPAAARRSMSATGG